MYRFYYLYLSSILCCNSPNKHYYIIIITAQLILNTSISRVPAGQGELEKVSEFEWSRKGQGHIFWKSQGKWKIGATRCQIFSLKCIKFDFRWGSAPDPAGGAYSAPPDTLAALNIAP